MMSKHVIVTGRVGGEALANRGGEAKLVDDGDLSAMVGETQGTSCWCLNHSLPKVREGRAARARLGFGHMLRSGRSVSS